MSEPFPNPKMSELQQMQRNYDKQYWNHQEEFEKIRHILLHLNKLTGKLATYCEAKEHGKEHDILDEIKQNVPADLLIYALQFANLWDQNLADMRDKRIYANIKKHTQTTPTPNFNCRLEPI